MSVGKLIFTGCQVYKSYTTKCKNPAQTENAINGEASQTEHREKRKWAKKDTPAGSLHQRAICVLSSILLWQRQTPLRKNWVYTDAKGAEKEIQVLIYISNTHFAFLNALNLIS